MEDAPSPPVGAVPEPDLEPEAADVTLEDLIKPGPGEKAPCLMVAQGTVDSNAVVCPLHAQVTVMQVLLRPRVVVPLLELLNLAHACALSEQAVRTKWDGSDPQSGFAHLLAPVGFLFITSYLRGLRKATAGDDNDGGALVTLGAGRERISKASYKWLVVRSWVLGFGVLALAGAGVSSVWWYTGNVALQILSVLFWVCVLCPLACWMYGTFLGAILVEDAVVEVIGAVRRTHPEDPRWQSEVASGVVKLASETLPLLSGCFGMGFIGVFLALWCNAIALGLRGFMDSPHPYVDVASAALIAFLPLVVAKDVANCSTRCGDLRVALGEKRKQEPTNKAVHDQIVILETIMRDENKGERPVPFVPVLPVFYQDIPLDRHRGI